jgi:CPA1 family monovalent cation:H+ antiporter
VLLATLVGQGGTLPWLLRRLDVKDDGTDEREERIALAATAKAALARLDELGRRHGAPPEVCDLLRRRFRNRWSEFQTESDGTAARHSSEFRRLERELIEAQRDALIRLRDQGKVDNTVMRKIQRLLDLQVEEMDLLETTGHADADLDA